MKSLLSILFFFIALKSVQAQVPDILNRANGAFGAGNSGQGGSRKDSIAFEHRDDAKDSINVTYRYLDSTNRQTLDSSVNNFDLYFPIPSSYQYLGNNGAAAYNLIFTPYAKPGWDAGFHAFDVYNFDIGDTRFYRTRRPFSTLGYELASGSEQMIQAGHTQTPKPNINFGFDYRLITAPGRFVTQNNTHNASRLYGSYQGKKKRYNGVIVFQGNNIKAAQNGGIANDSFLLDPKSDKRYSIPVNLGFAPQYSPNPFLTKVNTGNIYKQATFLLRQSWDIGKKDSLRINDSTTEYLFYPKLRAQHTFQYSGKNYKYNDFNSDSTIYKQWYNLDLGTAKSDTLIFEEQWRVLSNDFSLYQFPDTKNASQFLSAGVTLENIQQRIDSSKRSFYNAFIHGEYRNRTRNRLWDILASGSFYVAGLNSGDYQAYARISRQFRKLGDVELHFSNTNRTPSFIFDDRSAFNLGGNQNFKKENITSFGADIHSRWGNVFFKNHLIANYAYFKSLYEKAQYSKPLNIIQAGADKKIKLTKHINWYPEVVFQVSDKSAPIRVPDIYTRNRVAFEGNFFKNLFLSTGLELSYNTPYKPYNYSPVLGQFVPQDTATISNRPQINAFFHFRIKGFTGFVRAENLNTVSLKNGFGFVNNNLAAPLYPKEGFYIRFGIRWWYIN